MNLRGWLHLLSLVLTYSVAAQAQNKTLVGRWSASTLRTSYGVDTWGDACGPRPMGESSPGGIVAITAAGAELNIIGLGRNYSTASCWESVPGQRVTSHGASKRAWRTTCQSAAGDSRRVSIATSISATDDRIEFAETAQFEFAIEGQICKASMTRSRTYALVEREGESRPVPAQAVPSNPANAAAVPDHKAEDRYGLGCANPGPAVRIEVRPARKLLRAGDEFSFRVRVLDRSGCAIDRAPTWRLVDSNTRLEVTPAGIIRVEKDATEGAATLSASVQERSLQVTVDVVSESRYQELLSGGDFNDHGETRESAVATIASADVGAKAAVLEETARTRRLVFVAVIGAVALGLAAAALWMALGKRRNRQPHPPAADSQTAPSAPGGDMFVCPTCHEEYPAETRFCATDGNRLVPMPETGGLQVGDGGVCPVCGQGFDPGITACPVHDEELVPPAALGTLQSEPAASPRRICPVCGTVYGTEHQFCGNDGAALVPIN